MGQGDSDLGGAGESSGRLCSELVRWQSVRGEWSVRGGRGEVGRAREARREAPSGGGGVAVLVL
jgi:hypothetical protein